MTTVQRFMKTDRDRARVTKVRLAQQSEPQTSICEDVYPDPSITDVLQDVERDCG